MMVDKRRIRSRKFKDGSGGTYQLSAEAMLATINLVEVRIAVSFCGWVCSEVDASVCAQLLCPSSYPWREM